MPRATSKTNPGLEARCMYSRCRNSLPAAVAVALIAAALAGCERENREYTGAPNSQVPAPPRQSGLQPGQKLAPTPDPVGPHYEKVAFHINEGSRLFPPFNCNGCHANGGGGMGPALMDAQWRYGGDIEQIHQTILDGRPNGMPSFRGKLTDTQAWQLAAYVRALSGNVPKDAAPSRREGLA